MAEIKNLHSMIEFPKQGILSNTIAEGGWGEVDLFMLPRGEKISGHTASRNAAVQVLQGEMDFRLGTEWHRVKTGDWFFMEADLEHELKAVDDVVFLLTLFGAS